MGRVHRPCLHFQRFLGTRDRVLELTLGMIGPPEISMEADPRRAPTIVDAGFSPLARQQGIAARGYLKRPSSPTPTYKDKRTYHG